MSTPLVSTPSTVPFVYLGTTDLRVSASAEAHEARFKKMVPVMERKSFVDAAIRRAHGIHDNETSLAAYIHGDDWTQVGTSPGLMVGQGTAAEGDLFYGCTIVLSGNEAPHEVNQWKRVQYEGAPDGFNERGLILRNKLASAETVGGNGTGIQFPAAATAAQTSTLRVVVTAFTGTNITFQVESDLTDGWIGVETDVFSSTLAFTAAGHSSLSEVGATTGAWFRLVIAGTFSSCTYVAGFSIEP